MQVVAPAAPAPAPTTREIPTDPDERKKALASVTDEVDLCLGLADVIAAMLPPKRALSEEEKSMIRGPLAQVIYKHGGAIPCEWQLTIAVGFIAAGRYAEHKIAKAERGPTGTKPGGDK